MTKSAVRVIVRTRPTQNFAHGVLTVKPESSSVEVFIKKKEQQGVVNNARTNYSFTPDAVLHNASQDIVYDEAARDIVSGVMHGYNGAVLAYGQTGAGKTYTMTGPLTDYKVRGVIPRAVQQVFQEIAARPEQAITVRVSFLEIYNEALFDLLAPAGAAPADLMIIDDPSGSVYCRGLTMTVAATEEDVLNLLFEGTTNRAIAEHQLNKQSSRSHCLFSLHIEQRSRVDSSDRVLASKLHLIDLAGSERVSKTHTTGVVLKEAQYINRSLSFLEQVVNALTDKGRDHVPFRQSKLTHFMKDSLGGNCRTVMLANIWGEASQIEETISTLQFAMRMMKVKTEAFLNLQSDPAQLVKKYEREIRELKQELAMHDALTGRAAVGYDEYTEERRHEVMKSVKAYVADQIPDIEIPSLRHVKEVLIQFKIYAKALIANGPSISGGAGGGGGGAAGASSSAVADPVADGDGVGDVSGSSGFGLGVAADNARPLKGIAGYFVHFARLAIRNCFQKV
jgi:kinesin family protein 6/9